MGKIVETQLGEYRPVYHFDLNDVDCNRDDSVILEIEGSFEFGRVVSDVRAECKGKVETAHGKIIRKATPGDLKQIENNRMKAQDALNTCVRKVSEQKLEMRLVKAEYTFDCNKIIFIFVADGRVDFRNLVKELAKIFRVRIELKQIRVRDKAKIIGGYGVCGRELCCSSFIKDFHATGVKMAREQDLKINPSRTNGLCGRIKCCMAYEYQVYRDYAKYLPRLGDKVTTPDGKGKVVNVQILKHIVNVDLGDGQIVKVDYSKEMTAVGPLTVSPTKIADLDERVEEE